MVTAKRAKRPSLAAVADALLVQERDEALQRLEVSVAREAALAARLAAMVAVVRRTGEFMRHGDQLELRAAEAMLAEGRP